MSQPNIILISLDTTAARRLSCYGSRRQTSPHLSRFAAEGALFTECFSTHIPTHPAHTCMMTGRDPFETGIISQGAQREPNPGTRMLAEILREAGYFTAAADNLGRWFTRGFEVYEGYRWETPALGPWRKGEAVNQTALQVIDQCAGEKAPFFAFLHYWDPHTPYLPPAPFDRMFYSGDEKDPANPSMDEVWEFEAFNHYFAEWMPGVTDIEFPKAQYDACIAYLDSCLSHLFARLERSDLLDRTCVIITADHGEELDEHGCWFDHHGLYDTNLRVPLILHWPGTIRPGQRIDGLVRTLDITPTILDLAQLEAPEGQGQSFLPMLKGEQSGPGELFCTECTWMRKRAYRSRENKDIQSLEPDLHGKPAEELYDLQNDPAEQINLAEQNPRLAVELRRRLLKWQDERMAASGSPDPLEESRISLRQVGNPNTPVPRRARSDA